MHYIHVVICATEVSKYRLLMSAMTCYSEHSTCENVAYDFVIIGFYKLLDRKASDSRLTNSAHIPHYIMQLQISRCRLVSFAGFVSAVEYFTIAITKGPDPVIQRITRGLSMILTRHDTSRLVW